MFTDKMARITADFTSSLMEVLRAASREELGAREKLRPARVATKAKAPTPPAKLKAKPVVVAKSKTKKSAPAARPSGEATGIAIRYFADRGSKGATAQQLGSYLGEHGLHADSSLIATLTARGAIRDAGFRRSTGTGNKTSPVYVSAS